MRNSFSYWGITDPEVLALEAKYGPSFALLSPEQRVQLFAGVVHTSPDVPLGGACYGVAAEDVRILLGRDLGFYYILGQSLFQ